LSLGEKERRIGADSCQKYKRSYTVISAARIEDKNMNISYKNIMCKEFEDLVQIYTRGAPHFSPFAAFAFWTSYLLVYF